MSVIIVFCRDALEEEAVAFSRHLFATKHWFSRISSPNKKIFILVLLKQVNNAWAISLLLKAIWNCRPKDAVSSVCEKQICSSYDQVPLDHNRAAVPLKTLVSVMKSDREWFISLEPDQQAIVLSELLSIAGGPLMWTVLQEAQIIYEKYREDQLVNIQECMVVTEPPMEKVDKLQPVLEKGKKEPIPHGRPSTAGADPEVKQTVPGQAQKELDLKLAQWHSIIKTMKDSLKLEELEMTFTDGTKKKIWKVNRPIPEVIETVDFLQLLPSAIGKRILSFLPSTLLVDCARVNKYWAYLVDDLKAETAARLKIDADVEKLKELVLRHDTSMNTMDGTELTGIAMNSQMTSMVPSMINERPSLRPSEKSVRYSFRNLQTKKHGAKPKITPISNLAEMSERLMRRGATDDNLWGWCSAVLNLGSRDKSRNSLRQDGVITLGKQHFPCPLMKYSIQLPLYPPLRQDPTIALYNMPVAAFAELSKQVHVLNDLILEDMVFANDQEEFETIQFHKHLSAIKNWFTRISAPNKKRFLLALIEDISSAWALALILICIWNCRTKDAVMSVTERKIWSSYDRIPMDHNRTALPIQTLMQVMKSDRKWFLTLEPETQAMVICELLSVVGSPILLEILYRAQHIHERYRQNQIKCIETSLVVDDPPTKTETSTPAAAPQKMDKSRPSRSKSSGSAAGLFAQKKLNEHLEKWDATIKAMKEKMNLKEFKVFFKDGSQRTIWKMKRTNPEDTETVDFVQLLPSAIGKRILSYLPVDRLGDYARVNKFWAYLVEELKAERAARVRINADLDRLQDLMFAHDSSMENFETFEYKGLVPSIQAGSLAPSLKLRAQQLPSTKTSMKSAGAYSFRRFVSDRMNQPEPFTPQNPIRNLAQMTERLDTRGALDDSVWTWCAAILNRRARRVARSTADGKETDGGVLLFGKLHFPCPLMTLTLKLPLHPPLVKDHTARSKVSRNRNISNATATSLLKERGDRRVGLWTRNLSGLYHAFKVPSYNRNVK